MARMVVTDDDPRHLFGYRPGLDATHGWLAHLSATDDLPYPMSRNNIPAWPVTTACGKVLEARGTWAMLEGPGSNDLPVRAQWVVCLSCVLELL